MKTHGLQLENSQLSTAEGLTKLAAIAAKAAAATQQLVQARDGKSSEPAKIIFSEPEIAVLDGLNGQIEGKTALQKNPHRRHSLAWATWIVPLSGWNGYLSPSPQDRSLCGGSRIFPCHR